MKRFLVLLFLLVASVARAEPFPALYDVAGVSVGDVLNIRAEPGAASGVVGALAPLEKGVEVVRLSDDGGWGLVNASDGAGWVSMRYLSRQPGQDDGFLPGALSCFGVEPFWSLELASDGTVTFERAGSEPEELFPTSRHTSATRPDRLVFEAGGKMAGAVGFVTLSTCSDGMSEREYGMTLDLLMRFGANPGYYTGCCVIAR